MLHFEWELCCFGTSDEKPRENCQFAKLDNTKVLKKTKKKVKVKWENICHEMLQTRNHGVAPCCEHMMESFQDFIWLASEIQMC